MAAHHYDVLRAGTKQSISCARTTTTKYPFFVILGSIQIPPTVMPTFGHPQDTRQTAPGILFVASRLGGFECSREFGGICRRSGARLRWSIYKNEQAGPEVSLMQTGRRHGSVVRPRGGAGVKKTVKFHTVKRTIKFIKIRDFYVHGLRGRREG